MIEIIDTLGQKNNGSFPIVDSNDIKGGYYQVENLLGRDNIPNSRRKIGMLCYVENDKIYQLVGGIDNNCWREFYVQDGSSNDEIFVGSETPDFNYTVWIDTTDNEINNELNSDIVNELKQIISSLNQKILTLEEKVEFLMSNESLPPTQIDEVIVDEYGNYICDEVGNYISW